MRWGWVLGPGALLGSVVAEQTFDEKPGTTGGDGDLEGASIPEAMFRKLPRMFRVL